MDTIILSSNDIHQQTNQLFLWLIEELDVTINCRIHSTAITFCQDDVNECTQRVQLKLFDLSRRFMANQLPFNDHTSLLKYCNTTIRNAIIDYNRSRTAVSIPADKRGDYHVVPLSTTHEEHQHEMIETFPELHERSFAQMMEKLKQVDAYIYQDHMHLLHQKFVQKMSNREISQILAISERHVGVKVRKAVTEISSLLKELEFNASDFVGD
ncbi:sigma-70 family RNA polymerase sigma factor [Vibrio sp.]|uniref:sigma-70 family RNA polymerase sigma factor n=1 Tax=Vibrio sp. TaxID=678 RepID=UPI003D0CD740